MIKELLSQIEDTETAIEASERLGRSLVDKRDTLVRQLADAHIEALNAAPAEVRDKVLRYFRELETGTRVCPSLSE